MAMSIRTNVSSLNAQRALFNAGNDLNKSMQRLSSGFRINSSADDAAGLAISTKLQSQIGGLNQASMNAQDGISMIQTAEGALDEITSSLQRMRDLSVQAANATLSDTDRGNIDQEIQALYTNINNISSRTQFNGQSVLTGALTTHLDTATSGILSGLALTTTAANASVTSIDVTKAHAGDTYTLSAGTNANAFKLTSTTGAFVDNIAVADMASGGSQTLDFARPGREDHDGRHGRQGQGRTSSRTSGGRDRQDGSRQRIGGLPGRRERQRNGVGDLLRHPDLGHQLHRPEHRHLDLQWRHQHRQRHLDVDQHRYHHRLAGDQPRGARRLTELAATHHEQPQGERRQPGGLQQPYPRRRRGGRVLRHDPRPDHQPVGGLGVGPGEPDAPAGPQAARLILRGN